MRSRGHGVHATARLATILLALAPAARLAAEEAPAQFSVRLDTSKGPVVLEVHRDWAPRGADRFYELVRSGYYDDARFFRVIAGRWAQFGINGSPEVSARWRERTIPDDPPKESNVRGTVAFAFGVGGGRTTQVFINLGDNARLDGEGFAPFGRVVAGMEAVDALYAGYGEDSGGGIRGGKQAPLFEGGNAWLARHFPKLDFIRHAEVAPATMPQAVEGNYVIRGFRFASGETLPELVLHYRTLGEPRRGDDGRVRNAVVILHGTGGSGGGFLSETFGGRLFGPGQLIDAARYFIVLPDGIGHGGSSKPSDGLHAHFPHYTYDDMVVAQHQLLT
jgi:cyclophilin family peptidyl-prolyl cis-trans isomerase